MRSLAFSAFLALFLFPSLVFSQEPPGEQPGAQASRFQSEREGQKARRKKIRPEVDVRKEPVTAPVSGTREVSFVLTEVTVTGAAAFAPEELRRAYAPFIGRQVTFEDLQEITRRIKTMYTAKGYLFTDVYIPEQEIARGQVEIRVLEGRLGQVRVEGNRHFSPRLLRGYIHTAEGEMVDVFGLQRDVLRLNQNPDLDVKAVMSPGGQPGKTDLVLKVKESLPFHAGTVLDNQGTRLTGKSRGALFFRSTNFTGRNDSFAAYTMASRSSAGEFVSYSLPLGTRGTRAGIDATYFKLKLGKEFKDEDITGTTQIYTPHILTELYLAEDFQAYADIGMDIKSVKKRSQGEPATNDQLRMPFAALELIETDGFLGGGQTVFSPRVSCNFGGGFLGASSRGHPSASRPDTGGSFVRYSQSLRRIQSAPLRSFLTLRSQFQLSSHTLPSSEQLQLGGINSVRGYPEGDYLADTGVTLSTELSFPSYFIPEGYRLPHADAPLRYQLQPVIFLDMGWGKLKAPASGEKERKSLMGAGAGVRYQFNRDFSLRLEWAARLGDKPLPGQGESTFYLTCQFEL